MIETLSYNIIFYYNLVLFFIYILFCIVYIKNELAILIITLFFGGLFMDFINHIISRIIIGNEKVFSIGVLIWIMWVLAWTVKIFYKNYPANEIRKNHSIIITFFIYGIWFILSSVVNGDDLLLVLQVFSNDLIPLLFFLILGNMMQNASYTKMLNMLFGKLIIAQIFFTIVKLVIIGGAFEGLVGSLNGVRNGAPGTTLPLLGLLWIGLNTKMNLKTNHILMIIGLLFLGFMAGKRAVWIFFPILFILLSLYVYRRNYIKKMFFAILIIPTLFYSGLRLMPSFNPENKIWGSFDIDYALNYTTKYSAGIGDNAYDIEKGHGRIGALSIFLEHITSIDNYLRNIFFGYGNNYMKPSGETYYDNKYNFGISSRGSFTGIMVKAYSIGFIGALLYLLYLVKLLSLIKDVRLKHSILLLVLFDFIFYNASIVTIPSLFVLLIFLIHYSNNEPTIKISVYKRGVGF